MTLPFDEIIDSQIDGDSPFNEKLAFQYRDNVDDMFTNENVPPVDFFGARGYTVYGPPAIITGAGTVGDPNTITPFDIDVRPFLNMYCSP